MLRQIVFCGLLLAGCVANAAERWDAPYESQVFEGMPCRVMKPLGFDSKKSYPVIVSLHGAGGKGTNNSKQLKDWNRQLAEEQRRKDFPCYVVAPQAAGLWNAEHLEKIKALIKGLPSVDMDRIYILGHSMGGHGTYYFHNRTKAVGDKKVRFISGIGAGGQYMATFPEQNIVAVTTSHNQGNIGAPLDAMQTHLLPLFVK